jgi:hypothetical protein
MLNFYEDINGKKIFLAFLTAPLMTPFMFMVVGFMDGNLSLPSDIPRYLVPYGVFAYLATILFGVPAFFLFRALRWSHTLLFVLGGAVIGFIVSFFILESYSAEVFWNTLGGRLWCALAGALSALVFRLILKAKNKHLFQPKAIISVILLTGASLTVQAQSAGKTKPVRMSKSTSSKTRAPNPTPAPNQQFWMVKVLVVNGLRIETVLFNSRGTAMFQRIGQVGLTGVFCTYRLSARLKSESDEIMRSLRPQNWKAAYGDSKRIFRVTVKFEDADGNTKIYETVWRDATDAPKDLDRLLLFRDKVYGVRGCL